MPYSGLTGAVISGSVDVTEYEATMAQKEVFVRDGDDSITLDNADSNIESHVQEDEEHVAVSIDTTTKEETQEEESQEDESVGEETDSTSNESGELEGFGVNVDPKDLTEAGEMLTQAEEGQKEVLQKALDGGVTQEQLDAMQDEFVANNKLSDESYETLEKAGLSKAFINSFLQGQVAVGERFANTILNYVGGKSNFDKVATFMSNTNPDMVDAFNAAMDRHDTVTIKALLDTTNSMMKASYGTRPTRSLTVAAKPAPVAQVAPEVKGFESRQEMVKAMSDKRYERDAAYRKEVELRVFHSSF